MTTHLMKEDLPVIDPTTEDLSARRYLSVKEAAHILHVSTRSVYGYVTTGRLPAMRIGSLIVVEAQYIQTFQKQAVGRPRVRVPRWHVPPKNNAQSITVLTVPLSAGQEEAFTQQLHEMRIKQQHLLPGTAARYVARSLNQPDQVQIILVWRETIMPPAEERQAALEALRVDLSEVLDWERATIKEGKVALTA